MSELADRGARSRSPRSQITRSLAEERQVQQERERVRLAMQATREEQREEQREVARKKQEKNRRYRERDLVQGNSGREAGGAGSSNSLGENQNLLDADVEDERALDLGFGVLVIA